ncbi:DUF5677 domain-containing protein [uncultured Imperialibacter sp.]|uniref:DUF5677 domain-containing protein n=1 Tax=Imperialibacter sp. TaxID=2038411 RepID=UPI0030DB1F05|tara:strand:+ start:15054 stop:16103 length:1050 start_codon:yes stop_codon:yes gene_type:complete
MISEEEFFLERKIKKWLDERKASFKGTDEEFDKKTDKEFSKLVFTISKGIAKSITDYCISPKSDFRRREKQIGKKIKNRYSLGLELFTSYIELNTQISSITYNKYYKLFTTLEDHQKLDTLIALHVRACQIASEIRILVFGGFADGAHARWRTLHEVCITFLFLYDGDYELVSMYKDYLVIEQWRKAVEYQNSYKRLGWDPIPNDELEELESEQKRIVQCRGKAFSKSYGWAMDILPEGRRNIREIEKYVGMDHFRSIYAWAGDNVHAGVAGITEKLSLRDSEQYNFLTGPNDHGFLDPIQFTVNSLSEMSYTLLAMEKSTFNKIFEELLRFFGEEVVQEFSKQEDKDS